MHSHGHPHHHTHGHSHGSCNHGENCNHKSLRHRLLHNRSKRFYHIVGGLAVLGIMSLFAPAVMIALLVLGINTVLELHKVIMKGIPVDLEVLTLGVAYLAANGNPIVAACVAIVGPGLSEFFRGHVCTGTWFRPYALLAVIPVAMVTGPSFWGLFAAVVAGVVANYFRVLLTAPNSNPMMSLVSRGTQIIFALHLLTFIF